MQKFLLDTHILIWLAEEPQKLSRKSEFVLNSDNELLLSHACVWEMAIKIKTGKLKLKMLLEEFITKAAEKHKLNFLPILLTHIYQTQILPFHHRDPFDRLLIAQAITENIAIISSDEIFDAYNSNRIW